MSCAWHETAAATGTLQCYQQLYVTALSMSAGAGSVCVPPAYERKLNVC